NETVIGSASILPTNVPFGLKPKAFTITCVWDRLWFTFKRKLPFASVLVFAAPPTTLTVASPIGVLSVALSTFPLMVWRFCATTSCGIIPTNKQNNKNLE